MTSILLDDLPLTYRHVVFIAARLGYRYLWIDSLCVIQDSESDWERESSLMGDIYRGNVCIIAAFSAKDSHGGCFVNRNPLSYMPCRLSNIPPVVADGQWLFR